MIAAESTPFDLATYYPIFIYLFVILGFVVTSMIAAHVIGPRRNTDVKLMPYESGMDPIGDARQRFDIKFYLVAIMFLVFDVELLFLYPWAVVAYPSPPAPLPEGEGGYPTILKGTIFWSVLAFLTLLVVAYIYDWRKGVFKWR